MYCLDTKNIFYNFAQNVFMYLKNIYNKEQRAGCVYVDKIKQNNFPQVLDDINNLCFATTF